MEYLFLRNPSFAMVVQRDSCIFFRPDETSVTVGPPVSAMLIQFMQEAALPMSEERVGLCLDQETKDLLVRERIMLHAPLPVLKMLLPAPAKSNKSCRHLVLGLTGAISSVQVVPLVLDLLDGFADKVDVILTEGAMHMVNPQVLSYFGARVWTETFASRAEILVPHIHLAEVAEMIAVIPASAHTLDGLARGSCSDLLSLVIAATDAPVVLFPAMNRGMWRNAAINRNVRQLREDGHFVVEPNLGREVSNASAGELSYGTAGLGSLSLGKLLEEILHLQKDNASGQKE